MCQDCAEKYKGELFDELSPGGVGTCSVKDCYVLGADSANEAHYYVDFKPELIKPLTKEQLYELHPEQQPLDERLAEMREKIREESIYNGPDRLDWYR